MAAGSPLGHIVQHTIDDAKLDAGFLTPEGKITIFSDHIAMIVLAGFLLCLVVPWSMRRRRGTSGVDGMVPAGPANMLEAICVYLREEMARPLLEEHTDRFIKFIWSLFFFVLTLNLLGLLPFAAITPKLFNIHIGGTATANIWVTATLSLITLVMMVFNGFRIGGWDYVKHFNPGPWWMFLILVPIEIAGVFAKVFALTVRLFANMVAGHLILAVLIGFVLSAGSQSTAMGLGVAVPVVLGSVAMNFLEIFVAFLQAYVFTFLTTLFISMSVVFHHDDHEEAAAH